MTKALIVDDDEIIREMLADYFEELGIQSVCADSGLQGIEYFSQQQFDFVLSDIRMQNGDGLSLLKEIKKHSHSTPVYIMSGFTEDTVEELKANKVDHIFEKPLSLIEISDFISQYHNCKVPA